MLFLPALASFIIPIILRKHIIKLQYGLGILWLLIFLVYPAERASSGEFLDKLLQTMNVALPAWVFGSIIAVEKNRQNPRS